MGLCQTLLPLLTNPWTYAGLGITGAVLGTLYYYSSFTFLSGLMLFSRLTSVINLAFNFATKLWKWGLFKILAVYTTFEATIRSLATNGFGVDSFLLAGRELFEKITLSVKNIIDGFTVLEDWIGTVVQKGVCSGFSNNHVFFEGLLLIWTGVAAYIFVLWIWKKSWYDWRNVEMEEQEILLVLLVVTSLSLAVHGLGLVEQTVSTGKSLANTTAQLGGEMVKNNTLG